MAEYIDKKKAAAFVCKLICGGDCALCVSTPENCQQERMLEFYKIPEEDVAPVVHGKWENSKKPYSSPECSNCKSSAYEDSLLGGWLLTDFCPNCGAKLDG